MKVVKVLKREPGAISAPAVELKDFAAAHLLLLDVVGDAAAANLVEGAAHDFAEVPLKSS